MSERGENSDRRKALTSIHSGIHCAATSDTPQEQNELDQIAIQSFLDTLADVALAVAQRKGIDQ